MSDFVKINRRGPVLHVVNNNPAARNALSVEFVRDLTAALDDATLDRSIAALVISGAEGFFCAGGDLNVLKTRAAMSMPERIASINGLHDLIRAIRDCPRPVIAAVEGGAAGAGASLALACDLIVAEENAYFAVSYGRVGLTPDGGVTAFLTEFAPRQLASEILMFGDKIDVSRLYALGAVNRLTAKGQAVEIAQELGERLNKMAPEALKNAKRLISLAQDNDLAAQLDVEAEVMAHAQGGAEAGEGISAFLEKRQPDFTKFRL